MPWEWSEYLELARGNRTSATEAGQRNIISRSYYAAFGSARTYLWDVHQIALKNPSVHEKVQAELQSMKGNDSKIAGFLKTMCINRVVADYQISIPQPEKKVNENLGGAQQVLNLISQLKAPKL